MAQAILLRGGAGGITSDDVTASKAQVLQGYKTVTNDSDDEVVEGTIPNRGTWSTASEVVNASGESTVHVRFEEGYYIRDGQYKPTAKIPYAVLSNVIGVDTTKMLHSLTLAGKRGQIKEVDTRANNSRVNKSTSCGIDNWTDTNNPIFYIDLPHGNAYYHRNDGHPHTCIDASVLGNATADKVVAGSTFTSKNGVAVQGQIADRGDGAVVSYLQGREDWANRIWVLFKNGWYHREPFNDGQGHIHEAYVYVTYEQLKNLLGIDASKMLQGHDLAGVQGAIPKWACTTGDVISAYDNNVNDGFAWDDTYAGRGRGIVVHIPNGAYIQGANYVFLASPNLYPQNIREGVNVNGVVGTMVDYGAGGVPFNGATFDGRLASGVANKGFILRDIERYLNLKNNSYGYKGIVDGGLKLTNGYSYNTSFKSVPYVGFVLSKSVNLTPFRQLKVGFRFLRFSGDGTQSQPAKVSLEFGVTPINQAGGESYSNESYTILKNIGQYSNEISYEMTSTRVGAGNQSDQAQQYLTLDVSLKQGHHFIYFMLGKIIHEYSNGSVYAEVIINHIELIN